MGHKDTYIHTMCNFILKPTNNVFKFNLYIEVLAEIFARTLLKGVDKYHFITMQTKIYDISPR